MDLGLGGKVALVMGASKGIGRGVAAALAREGARVALASRSQERLDAAAAEIGERASAFVADATDLERLARLPLEVAEALGSVDILITNTGGPPPGGALDHGFDEWEQAYRSLVLAPRVLAGAVVPGMRGEGWGRIVNVGSTTTIEINPALGLSNANRMATVGFLKTLAREVAGDGITVNTVATGRFATDRMAELAGSMELVEEVAQNEVPAGRLGTVEEYGDLVAFLCSERAAYITGAVIPIDGGLLHSAFWSPAGFSRIDGKRITSRRVFELQRISISLSTPSPQPLAVSIPYSSARTNSSSCSCGFSSAPDSWRCRCSTKCRRCSSGSLTSVPPPVISIPATIPSKASPRRSGALFTGLTRGQRASGRS